LLWQEFCTFCSEGNVKERAMFANVTSLTVNPMFLRHDLLIELGRLETAIEAMRSRQPANDAGDLYDAREPSFDHQPHAAAPVGLKLDERTCRAQAIAGADSAVRNRAASCQGAAPPRSSGSANPQRDSGPSPDGGSSFAPAEFPGRPVCLTWQRMMSAQQFPPNPSAGPLIASRRMRIARLCCARWHRRDSRTRTLAFKCENFQRAGAFKFRGACNSVWALSDAVAAHGVVTHSSGNHGAALALAAKTRGIPAHVVVPEDAIASKVAAIRPTARRCISARRRWRRATKRPIASAAKPARRSSIPSPIRK
jgi:hypothetical protein